jgi:protein SCO1
MDGLTRRKCIAMAGVPVVAGLGAYAALERVMVPDDKRREFPLAGRVSARSLIQQRHLPNLPLITHDGRRVRFYDDLVKDKKVVLTFLSSHAQAESKTVMHNLAAIQRFFGRRVGDDIFLYSIARNPERDTPAVLKRWAARSGAGPGWLFLTGDPGDVERLRHDAGFASPSPGEDAHATYAVGQLRHGVEPEMRWAHCQALAPPRVIVHSMLLDFGAGPDPGSGISWTNQIPSNGGPAPVFNCELLLAEVK